MGKELQYILSHKHFTDTDLWFWFRGSN